MDRYKQQIALQDLRFYAYHGFYPEEQVLGNEFIVHLHCEVDCLLGEEDDLASTVNYEVLYGIVKEEMGIVRKLLETVAERILTRVKVAYPFVIAIEVRICKINPPFGGDRASASVSLSWHSTDQV